MWVEMTVMVMVVMLRVMRVMDERMKMRALLAAVKDVACRGG